METTPSTCFLTRGLIVRGSKTSQVKLRFHHLPSRNLLSVSCKSRPRNSSLYKRQSAKKINLEQQANINVESNGDGLSNPLKESSEDSDKESSNNENLVEVEADDNSNLVNSSKDDLADPYEENISNENVPVKIEADVNSNLNDSSKDATLDSDKENINNENVSIKEEADGNSNLKNPSIDSAANSYEESTSNGNAPTKIEAEISESTDSNNSYPLREVLSLHNDTLRSMGDSSQSEEKREMDSFFSNDIVPLSTNADGAEQHSGVHLQDLIGMIRHAEKNIHLLNQARMRTIEDLEKVFSEKEALQREITILEMKLTETDARLTVAAQEKIRVEILEAQLENLRNELSSRDSSEQYVQNMYSSVSFSQIDAANSFSQELDSLRAENMSLKDELLVMKEELNSIKGTDERVKTLEKERSVLESSLKELELKLTASYEDVSKIPSLRSECKTLYEKVEDLQNMLIKATKQADEAILVLKQNEEFRKKVDRIEESLKEANSYKLSSERLQQYNETMQQKIQLLDERLQRSDEEIHSYVQLYQDSVQEFQDTLNDLKEESKKRQQGEAIHDKPWEFWSNLLLMVDGWYLEKKISADEAELLRELIWDKEENVCDAYMSSKGKSEREIITSFLSLTPLTTGERFHVIHIAAEMAPVAKVGGLGDVVTGLGKALQRKGHLVEIILPKYDCMQYESVQDLKALDVPVESYFDGQLFKNKIWVGTVEGLPVYFIEPQHPSKFFWRGEYYGENDDFKRFSFFSRAALELILQAGKKPDIIHCHDWQTAFVAPLYWDLYAPKGLNSARICFTCHNFEYQGTSSASDLASCGLDVHHLNRPDRMQDHSANDRINPVKGAIVFSNIVTTVSPSYAQEVRTSEGGRGLHATLNSHSKKFVGILNGIDTDAWNPATDPFLTSQYNANEIEGKAENKEALRRYLGLSSDNVLQPLVACITRLVPQKGVHLIRHAIYRTLELGGQFVLLGSSPVPQIQREFEEISNYFKTHEHARLILKYDESLSHLIYAASDMFIIPSIFEPCGLTQMIAMRYGAIPIARKTGGLNDSVFDVDDDKVPVQYKNGFTFLTADEQGFNNAIERAFNHYKNDIDGWKELVQKDMNIDFSWDASASLYEGLYENSISRARATTRR